MTATAGGFRYLKRKSKTNNNSAIEKSEFVSDRNSNIEVNLSFLRPEQVYIRNVRPIPIEYVRFLNRIT